VERPDEVRISGLISTDGVGDQDFAAELVLVAEVAHPGEELGYAIANTGDAGLICGLGYLLERFDDQDWVALNAGQGVRATRFEVGPGERKELTAHLPRQAPPGRYRITTHVYPRYTPRALKLTATLEVVPSP
jgi:hypothetical protein